MRKITAGLAVLGILGISIGLWGHYRPAGAPFSSGGLVVEVTEGEVVSVVKATGTMDGWATTTVGAQVSGVIEELPVEVGSRVAKGDLLARIDAKATRQSLQIALLNVDRYRAQKEATARQLALKNEQLAVQEKLVATEQAPGASVLDLKQSREQLLMQQGEAASNERSARVEVEKLRTQLAYAEVRAPQAGVIVSRPVSKGQTLNANQSSPTLMIIATDDTLRLKLEVAQLDVPKVSLGQKVRFSAGGLQGAGLVTQLDPAPVWTSNNVSKTDQAPVYYYATVRVPNENFQWKIGMTAEAQMELHRAKGLVVPSAVVSPQHEVQLVVDKTAPDRASAIKLVKVEPGLTDGTLVEIKSGLKKGDLVYAGVAKEAQVQISRSGPPGPM